MNFVTIRLKLYIAITMLVDIVGESPKSDQISHLNHTPYPNSISRGEAALLNIWANRILLNKSNKSNLFLKARRYNENYWLNN